MTMPLAEDSECEENDFRGAKKIMMSKPTFDDVIDQLRGFGPFQWRVFLISNLLKIITAAAMLLFVFVGANPGWDCGTTSDEASSVTNKTEDATSRRQELHFDVSCALNSSVCPHIYHKDFTSAVTEWDLVCSRDYIPTIITSIMMSGVGIGAGLVGYLADKYGRRHVLYGVSAGLVIVLFLQGFAPNWQTFAALRFLAGVGVGGNMVVGSVLPVEVVGRQWRVLVSVISGWQVGILVLAGTSYFIRDWRQLTMALAAIGAPFLAGWFFVPECARWLIQRGRFEEALVVVKEMARLNHRQAPSLEDLQALAEPTRGQPGGTGYTYLDLFRTPTLARTTVTMMLLWFTASVTIYGIAVNIQDFEAGLHGNMTILATIDFIFYVIFIPLVKWFGRKPVLLGYLFISLVATVTIAVCDHTGTFDQAPYLRMTVALTGLAGMSTTWAGGYLLVAELFPTVVRNLAMGISSIAARFGGVLAPQVAYLSFLHPSIPYVIYAVLTIFTAMLILLLPETRGRPLPDALPPTENSFCCSRRKSKSVDIRDNKQEVEIRFSLNSE